MEHPWILSLTVGIDKNPKRSYHVIFCSLVYFSGPDLDSMTLNRLGFMSQLPPKEEQDVPGKAVYMEYLYAICLHTKNLTKNLSRWLNPQKVD